MIKEISNYLNGEEKVYVSDDMKFAYCLKHARKLIEMFGEKAAISQMRGLAPHYLSGMYSAAKYRLRLNSINSYDELAEIIDEYKSFLAER